MDSPKRVTRNELGTMLMKHVQGTAAQPLAENRSYITDPESEYVAVRTIQQLQKSLREMVQIFQMLPRSERRGGASKKIEKIRGAITALGIYLPRIENN
jgi:hypothetical protein